VSGLTTPRGYGFISRPIMAEDVFVHFFRDSSWRLPQPARSQPSVDLTKGLGLAGGRTFRLSKIHRFLEALTKCP